MNSDKLPKEIEKVRDAMAHDMANHLAIPVIRSMYPLRSRGEMHEEFSKLYTTAFNKGYRLCEERYAELTTACDELFYELARYNDSAWKTQRNPIADHYRSIYEILAKLRDEAAK